MFPLIETTLKPLKKKAWFLPLIFSLLTSPILIIFSLFFTSSSNPIKIQNPDLER